MNYYVLEYITLLLYLTTAKEGVPKLNCGYTNLRMKITHSRIAVVLHGCLEESWQSCNVPAQRQQGVNDCKGLESSCMGWGFPNRCKQ